MGENVEVNLSSSLKQAKQWDWPLNRNDGIVEIINTDEKFEVVLEAAFFQPKEIEVGFLYYSSSFSATNLQIAFDVCLTLSLSWS